MIELDWRWCPNEIKFDPFYPVSAPSFGRAAHGFMSPFWMVDLKLPPQLSDARRDIEAFRAETEGLAIINVCDARVPYPKRYLGIINQHTPLSIIPDLIVTAATIADSTITVVGEVGDVISIGDPIAFTHDDNRYYFKAMRELRLDGTEQVLKVYIRPRKSLVGISILADRIKPTCRFLIKINEMGGTTGINKLTNFTLSGTEYWKAVT